MALIPVTLAQDIEDAFATMANNTGDANAARKQAAQLLATAIDKYIKSAQVTGTATTAVTGTAGSFPVVGVGTGSITGTLL